MSATPFLTAIVCWTAAMSLNNGFNRDWQAYKCMHYGCSDAEWAVSAAWLVGGWIIGIIFPVIFMLVFAKRNIGRFFLFLAVLLASGYLIAMEAIKAGDRTIFNPSVWYMAGMFLIYIVGAIIVSIPKRGK